jgi:hypothetical protein
MRSRLFVRRRAALLAVVALVPLGALHCGTKRAPVLDEQQIPVPTATSTSSSCPAPEAGACNLPVYGYTLSPGPAYDAAALGPACSGVVCICALDVPIDGSACLTHQSSRAKCIGSDEFSVSSDPTCADGYEGGAGDASDAGTD